MTEERMNLGLSILEEHGNQTMGQMFKILAENDFDRQESIAVIAERCKEATAPMYDEHGFLNEIDRHKKRKES